jgi:hypothetical protein
MFEVLNAIKPQNLDGSVRCLKASIDASRAFDKFVLGYSGKANKCTSEGSLWRRTTEGYAIYKLYGIIVELSTPFQTMVAKERNQRSSSGMLLIRTVTIGKESEASECTEDNVKYW